MSLSLFVAISMTAAVATCTVGQPEMTPVWTIDPLKSFKYGDVQICTGPDGSVVAAVSPRDHAKGDPASPGFVQRIHHDGSILWKTPLDWPLGDSFANVREAQTVDIQPFRNGGSRILWEFKCTEGRYYSITTLDEAGLVVSSWAVQSRLRGTDANQMLVLSNQVTVVSGTIDSDVWLMAVDSLGRRLWEKQQDFGQTEIPGSLLQGADGDIYVTSDSLLYEPNTINFGHTTLSKWDSRSGASRGWRSFDGSSGRVVRLPQSDELSLIYGTRPFDSAMFGFLPRQVSLDESLIDRRKCELPLKRMWSLSLTAFESNGSIWVLGNFGDAELEASYKTLNQIDLATCAVVRSIQIPDDVWMIHDIEITDRGHVVMAAWLTTPTNQILAFDLGEPD